MWLYLENESFIFIEAVIFALIFFAFQLVMCIKARLVRFKLVPIYVFALFSALLLALPFILAADITGNWGLIFVTLFNIGELSFIGLFIGLAWATFAIISACRKNKQLKEAAN